MSQSAVSNIIVGEAALWTEQIDDQNAPTTLWMRLSAVAERLWSSKDVNDATKALPRLQRWRTAMGERGFQTTPLQPLWCALHEGGVC